MWEGISGLITLIVMCVKLWVDHKNLLNEAVSNEDKKIDAANDADSIMRASGGLHNDW